MTTVVASTPSSTIVTTENTTPVVVSVENENKTVITVDGEENVVVTTIDAAPLTINTSTSIVNVTVEADTAPQVITTIGEQGPRGPAGDSGIDLYPANQVLSGHKIVALDTNGKYRLADCRTLGDLYLFSGIIDRSYSTNEDVEIKINGIVSHEGWTFTPLQPVFLGIEGTITQTLPVDATFTLVVGVAVDATSVAINFLQPIINI